MLVYITLTDLDYPDDEPSLYVRVDAITSFRNVQHKNNDQFKSHFAVINLVGGTSHAVTESAEEVQSKMIEAMDKAYNMGDDDANYTFAPSGPLELDDEDLAKLCESLGLDDATLEREVTNADLQHTLAWEQEGR